MFIPFSDNNDMESLIYDGFDHSKGNILKELPAVNLTERKSGLYYELTFIGSRKKNEDTILIPSFKGIGNNLHSSRCHNITLPHGYFLFAVADGMGGANSGEIASELAVKVVKEEIDNKIEAGK